MTAEKSSAAKRTFAEVRSVALEIHLATWRAALEATGGNIKRAAAVAGIARSHATRLMKKYNLQKWAAELRNKAGNPSRGRPKISGS